MHVFLYPLKDSTIYSDSPTQNCGNDEILEIIKRSNITYNSIDIFPYSQSVNNSDISRVLVKFDLSYISQSISSGNIVSPRFYLNFHICKIEGQPEFLNLYIYPIQSSSNWVEGTGKRFDSVIRKNGVSWLYKDGEALDAWTNSGGDYIDSIVVTSSIWPDVDNFLQSGVYKYQLSDLRADISEIVYSWLSGSYENNGLIIKRSSSEEQDSKDYGTIQFYSNETNTIYSPSLEVAWDDSSFVTGSLIPSDINNMFIYTKNLKSVYNNSEIAKIYIGTRETFPSKSYTDEFPYSLKKYLPETSYYSIVDANSTETIIPFDTGSTKISCDPNGNYFYINMRSFHPERFYRLRIKVTSGSIENIYDIPNSFKIIR